MGINVWYIVFSHICNLPPHYHLVWAGKKVSTLAPSSSCHHGIMIQHCTTLWMQLFFFLLLYWNLHTMYNYLYLSERTPYYLLFYYWVSLKKQKSVTKYILCYTKDPVVSHLPITFPQHFQIFLQSKRHLPILLLTTSTTLNSGFINFISRGNNRDAKKTHSLLFKTRKRDTSRKKTERHDVSTRVVTEKTIFSRLLPKCKVLLPSVKSSCWWSLIMVYTGGSSPWTNLCHFDDERARRRPELVLYH